MLIENLPVDGGHEVKLAMTTLYESVQEELVEERLFVSSVSPEKMILSKEGDIVVSDARAFSEHLQNKYPDVIQTTNVVFVTGSTDSIDFQAKFPTKISTDLGKALCAEQAKALPRKTPPETGSFYNGLKKHESMSRSRT